MSPFNLFPFLAFSLFLSFLFFKSPHFYSHQIVQAPSQVVLVAEVVGLVEGHSLWDSREGPGTKSGGACDWSGRLGEMVSYSKTHQRAQAPSCMGLVTLVASLVGGSCTLSLTRGCSGAELCIGFNLWVMLVSYGWGSMFLRGAHSGAHRSLKLRRLESCRLWVCLIR